MDVDWANMHCALAIILILLLVLQTEGAIILPSVAALPHVGLAEVVGRVAKAREEQDGAGADRADRAPRQP